MADLIENMEEAFARQSSTLRRTRLLEPACPVRDERVKRTLLLGIPAFVDLIAMVVSIARLTRDGANLSAGISSKKAEYDVAGKGISEARIYNPESFQFVQQREMASRTNNTTIAGP